MSWVIGVIGFVSLFGAFGFLNGALERKRDCHGCSEEERSPACDTCPLAPDERRGRPGLSLVRNHAGKHNAS